MANYPTSPVTFPARSDGQTIFAAHVQALQDEVAAMESGLLGQLAHTLNAGQAIMATGVVTPAQITGDQTDYNPAGLATCSVLRLTTDAPRGINSIQAQPSGRVILVINAGSFPIAIRNNGAGVSTNRIANSGFVDQVLQSSDTMALFYDGSAGVWRGFALSQGGNWIQVAFNVANFWTGVTAGHVTMNQYSVLGKTMFWILSMAGSVAPSPAVNSLPFIVPGGGVYPAQQCLSPIANAYDGATVSAYMQRASNTQISGIKATSTNWTATLGNLYIYATSIIAIG